MGQFKPSSIRKDNSNQRAKEILNKSTIKSLPADQSHHNDTTSSPASQQIDKTKLEPVVSAIQDDSLFGSVVNIPLCQIDSNEAAIRTIMNPERLDQLISSIKEKHLINPIILRQIGERYRIVCGHRRFKAFRQLGSKTIPARLLNENVSVEEERRIQLVENLNHEDLTRMELSRALYQYLSVRCQDLKLPGMIALFNSFKRMPTPLPRDTATVAAIRNILGNRSLGTIRNLLSLQQLPPELIQAIENDDISYSSGFILASHRDDPDFDNIAARTVSEKLTRDDLKEIFRSSDQTQENHYSRMYSRFSRRLNTLEQEVKDHLHEISSDEAQALQEKLKGLNNLMDQW